MPWWATVALTVIIKRLAITLLLKIVKQIPNKWKRTFISSTKCVTPYVLLLFFRFFLLLPCSYKCPPRLSVNSNSPSPYQTSNSYCLLVTEIQQQIFYLRFFIRLCWTLPLCTRYQQVNLYFLQYRYFMKCITLTNSCSFKLVKIVYQLVLVLTFLFGILQDDVHKLFSKQDFLVMVFFSRVRLWVMSHPKKKPVWILWFIKLRIEGERCRYGTCVVIII